MEIGHGLLIDMQGVPTELLIVGEPLSVAIKTNGASLHFPPGCDYIETFRAAAQAFWKVMDLNGVTVKPAP